MIVVGAGRSSRFGEDKLMAEVAGRPLIEHTIEAVEPHVDVCVVVCRPELSDRIAAIHPHVEVATGGATRTLSEMAGLASVGGDVDLIGIHDAARPVVSEATIHRLFEAAHAEGGAIPLLAYQRLIVDRRTHQPVTGLHGAQTPQVFRGPELMAAYVRAAEAGFEGHDTAEVMEKFSEIRIVGVEGDRANVKVTFPADLEEVRSRLTGPSRT